MKTEGKGNTEAIRLKRRRKEKEKGKASLFFVTVYPRKTPNSSPYLLRCRSLGGMRECFFPIYYCKLEPF